LERKLERSVDRYERRNEEEPANADRQQRGERAAAEGCLFSGCIAIKCLAHAAAWPARRADARECTTVPKCTRLVPAKIPYFVDAGNTITLFAGLSFKSSVDGYWAFLREAGPLAIPRAAISSARG
jgi:hypothetical protein